MKNHLRRAPLLFLLLLASHHLLLANELYPVPLTQRVSNSALIAEGKVIAQYSFQPSPKGNIYTSNLVQVYRTFKGSLQGEQIEIITEGGTVGRLRQVHSSTLSLNIGETGVFFCMPAMGGISSGRTNLRGNSYMVYSSLQGFIAYDNKTNTAADPFTRYNHVVEATQAVKQLTGVERRISEKPIVVDHQLNSVMGPMATPTISGFTPTTIAAGTDAILTISGSNFGAVKGTGFVEFRNANSASASAFVQPLLTDYISWTDTEIQVRVPSVSISGPSAGTGVVRVTNSDPATGTSAGTVTIPYSYTNIPDTDNPGVDEPTSEIPSHVDWAGTGGYTFQMETSFAANTAASNSFKRAMHTWTCKTGMNWTVGAVTTVNTVSSEGINVVRFDVGSELPAGVLGRCTSWYAGCGAASPYIWVVAELDVVFDGARPWQYGPADPVAGEIDFESVAVHELGHGHQLNHIISPGAVMHFAIAAGAKSRVLGAGDITGGNVVMARALNDFGCMPPIIVGNPLLLSSPAGTQGGAQVCVSGVVAGGGTNYTDADCDLIARIVPSGVSPVSGSINVCTKYESTIATFNSQPYCERRYDIEPVSGASTATATVTLYYTQAEFDAFNAANGAYPDLPTGSGDMAGIANLRITQFHGTSGTGAPGSYSGTPALINPTDGNIAWNATASRWEITFNVTGFSGFFVHTGSSTLPLRLLQFSGTISGSNNLLQWTTASEEQTASFDIQRSIDGVRFTTIGQVAASGSTTSNKQYRYTDDVSSNVRPTYYYRLKMVDDNGQFTYSAIITLERNNRDFLVKVLQNPFRQQLQATITSPQLQDCSVTLTDMNGRIVAQRKIVLQKGTALVDIPVVQGPGAGTYVLTFVTTTGKQVIKVVKEQ
ncbi:MAG: T9SS type A sorting domain-containing protein [Niastella sp.]|nr:T9SS type A sorting domain-containing protein [Niastella sp.]